ncbi:hypothetical protein [Colwellia psychrerythraea]|uniref:Uncharacterized protein n=1 Tax=Colwellia psychrerythraea TaxID=28229 RepID=A0A099L3A3_COLPS|nr:hypothetical protein [Colwellia psychrerythraea]KGJ97444.1 hypothetical protein GAB14E_1033 [Colwellia psychrerythraea]
MNNIFGIKLAVILCAALVFSKPSFAGLITIDNDVQDTWWWSGVVQSNDTELRTNDVSKSDQRIGVQFNNLSALDNIKIVSAELQM